MEENFILATQVVKEKEENNKFYYMFVCALFGLFMKYPDDKDLIIDAFKKTKIIIEDKPVIDIDKEYELNLFQNDKLESEDETVCINLGVSDLGFNYFIQDDKIKMEKTNPTIVCSSLNNSPAKLLNIFVHELNHIIKSRNNSYGYEEDGKGISSCFQRCGLSYLSFTYDKSNDTVEEKEFYSILDEVINTFQTTEILKYILMLDGIVPDVDFQKYFDSLDKKELKKVMGYEKCCNLFRKVWDNETLKNILEKNLIDGNLMGISIEFDDAVGLECFDLIADYLDDLDYLFCLNNNRKAMKAYEKQLDDIIKNITENKIKK